MRQVDGKRLYGNKHCRLYVLAFHMYRYLGDLSRSEAPKSVWNDELGQVNPYSPVSVESVSPSLDSLIKLFKCNRFYVKVVIIIFLSLVFVWQQ